jgi:hypothetical protein
MPQLIEDRALDAVHGIGFELEPSLGIEFIDRIDQAKCSEGHQVVLVNVAWKTRANTTCNEFHERRIVQDESLSRALITSGLVLRPLLLEL